MIDKEIIHLDWPQIERCYEEFDFEEYEIILDAWFEDGQLVIHYVNDKNNRDAYYEPTLDGAYGDKKREYILYGIKETK